MPTFILFLRLVRYFAVLGAVIGSVRIWGYEGWSLAIRIPFGIVVLLGGLGIGLLIANWQGDLAARHIVGRERREMLIKGKWGPPRSPHDR
ncbi:hypothetical protein D5S17_03320 [Pseudonocardiaceae bacterium YIM PH 21723]|nr:hypothetical protein D5S17_03320 [Pseudonocardiaceae bacterium YIM PH 21723]